MQINYVPIRVSTLRGDQKIDFDAYVKINDKYILYLRSGDSFEGDRLKRLRDKKLKKMFILPDAEEKYRNYLHRNIEMAYNRNSGQSLSNRVEIIQGNQQSNAEAVMENPENEFIYNETRDAAGQFVDFLAQEDPLAMQSIMKMDNVDQNICHHGVTVSTLAVSLAKRLNIYDPKQLQLLTLGSLLHDFEHFHSGILINRPLSAFTPEELQLYKTHPIVGGQKVRDKKHFDQTVINIIVQHEEYIDGSGFPNGLNEAKIDPLAMITASCNALDRLITFEGINKKDAVKKLMISSVGKYPLAHIQALGDIMNSIKFV
jgi:HD-GYP domain-containing protein (c-di-GMP phosphodiesterase class II)